VLAGEQGGQVSYRLGNIADYQPIINQNSLPATPSFMAASDTHIAEGESLHRAVHSIITQHIINVCIYIIYTGSA
jgi:hypothetical protein